MYLEIRLKNYFIVLLIIFCFLYSSTVFAQESKDIPINVIKPEYLQSDKLDIKIINKYPLEKEYRLFKDSSVYKVHTGPSMLNPLSNTFNLNKANNRKNIVGQYLYAYSKSELPIVLEAFNSEMPVDSKIRRSEPVLVDKFRVILDDNDRVYFTDGSFIVKFSSPVNFSNFASTHNLMLKKEFIDLNMGLYSYSDFSSLEEKINLLKDINTISSVRYNVINPYILAE